MTEIRRTSTPSARSSRQRYAAFASAILPDRISLPMRMIPAVFGMACGDSTMLECGRPRKGDAMTEEPVRLSGWALVLGASSGFGEATSLALARAGLNIFRVLLHSLALGTLKLYVADPMKDAVTQAQMDMTLDVMAHSLVYWTQEVVGR